jgi:homoserine kinase
VLHAARVRVPASTSNLGAGFDCIGLALDRHLTATFRPSRGGSLVVERLGTLCALAGRASGEDLFVVAFRGALAAAGVHDVGGQLTLDSDIPVARGLGSSAVAVVGGAALAAAARGVPVDAARVLAQAAIAEGHLDNAAPALLGGLVGVAQGAGGAPVTFALPLAPSLAFVFAAPGVELSTARARAALPATVAHAEAITALGRVAALVRALETGDPALLAVGLSDTLHVPYRLPLIPGGTAVVDAGRRAGAYGVTVSGAGSGLLAITSLERAPEVAAAMAETFAIEAGPEGVVSFVARPDREGTTVVEVA